MNQQQIALTERRLRTPRAAAVAGILFAVLFTISIVLIRLSIPAEIAASGWWERGTGNVAFALGLMPFAGIAFLWFMGVVRDRLGHMEDQFFSTVFFGSGLLFIAMAFAAAGIAGALITSYSVGVRQFAENDVYFFGRAMMSQIFNIYSLRMAGVFMISLGTIWLRTGVMPPWVAFLTYAVALTLLLSINLSLWMVLIFPGWVFAISVYILVLNFRRQSAGTGDGLSSAG